MQRASGRSSHLVSSASPAQITTGYPPRLTSPISHPLFLRHAPRVKQERATIAASHQRPQQLRAELHLKHCGAASWCKCEWRSARMLRVWSGRATSRTHGEAMEFCSSCACLCVFSEVRRPRCNTPEQLQGSDAHLKSRFGTARARHRRGSRMTASRARPPGAWDLGWVATDTASCVTSPFSCASRGRVACATGQPWSCRRCDPWHPHADEPWPDNARRCAACSRVQWRQAGIHVTKPFARLRRYATLPPMRAPARTRQRCDNEECGDVLQFSWRAGSQVWSAMWTSHSPQEGRCFAHRGG